MYCPRCGHEQKTDETKFCSRCGFLLIGVWNLILNNGLPIQTPAIPETDAISPRRKGLKQGGQLMLLGLIVVPLLVIVSALFHLHPALVITASVLTFWSGILRMLYARVFESKYPNRSDLEKNADNTVQNLLAKKADSLSLEQSTPVSSYIPPVAGNWQDTNDLAQPSVTENTTKLLERDK